MEKLYGKYECCKFNVIKNMKNVLIEQNEYML